MLVRMTAAPPFSALTPALPEAAFSPASTAGDHWAALSGAAALVAALAELEPRQPATEAGDIAALLGGADLWRRERAEQGLADLAAMMEPGLSALLAVNARGADPRPAARALWREFTAARDAVLTLLGPARA